MARHRAEKRAKRRAPRLSAEGVGGGAASVDTELEALSVTHWFDVATDGDPYPVSVRFRGRRVGVSGKPTARDQFTKEETIDGVLPGSGPMSVTTWVYGLNAGEWSVTAELIESGNVGGGWRRALRPRSDAGTSLPRASWSWRRWRLGTGSFAPVKTRWAPTVRLTPMPGVLRGSWSGLIALGILVGVLVQIWLLDRQDIGFGEVLIVDLVALVSGLIGAKLWYIALRPHDWRERIGEGWSIDGALVGAPVAGVFALMTLDLPAGGFLDASTPAFFFGVAIGRLGCFFTGCCAGRLTRSHWGIWSSDRRVGARRIPAQLIEAAAGLLIGGATLVLALGHPHAASALFIGGATSYILIRQGLLRVRAQARGYTLAARLTAAAAAIILAGDAITVFVGVS